MIEKISGIEVERRDAKSGSGVSSYKLKGEKRGSKPLGFDPQNIRNDAMRNEVQCIRYIRKELKGIKMSYCSFQLICALTAKYLGTYKKDVICSSLMRTKDGTYVKRNGMNLKKYKVTRRYPQKVYDLAHAVYFLAMEFKF
jgi:hypothetical protein